MAIIPFTVDQNKIDLGDKFDVPSALHIVETEAVMILPLYDAALRLDAYCHRAFVREAEPGIYRDGSIELVCYPHQVVHLQRANRNVRFKDLDFNGSEDRVLDAKGKFLFNLPLRDDALTMSAPIGAFNYIKLLCVDNIMTRCAWFDGKRNSARGQMVAEYQYLHDEGHLDSITDELTQAISKFIPNSCWNLVCFSVQEGNLIVHRQTDYRIFEWTRIKYERNLLEQQALAATNAAIAEQSEHSSH